jgi:hypothetical protein
MPFDGRILSGVSVLAAAAVVDGGSFVLIGLTHSGVSLTVTKKLRWPSAPQEAPILRRTSAEMSLDA